MLLTKLLTQSKVYAIAIVVGFCIAWQQPTPIRSVLDSIASYYKINFAYESRLLQHVNTSYNFVPGRTPLHKVLQELLTPLGLKASKLDNKNFAIVSAKRFSTTEPAASDEDSIATPENTDSLLPVKTIRGRTVSENGETPVPGVSVTVRNMKIGTTSDADGYFSLRIPGETHSISFGHISYYQENMSPAEGKTQLLIKLKPKNQLLEQVIVTTGLYKRPKENFTGAATTISGEDLRKVNSVNVLEALKVFDPAIRIPDDIQFGSDPNRLPAITLRGTNNFPQQTTGTAVPASGADFMANYSNNPNQPLFILDGFEVSLQKIYDLDINRVTTFTILKDAAATAMYGSKAANGVIVVETRQPQTGRLRVSYSGMVNVTAPDLTVYDLTNAADKLEVERLAGVYSAYATGIRPDADAVLRERYADRLTAVQRGVNTYWLSKPVTTGIGNRHSIYLEGGDAFIRYGLDLSYNNNTGVMKNSDRKNYSGGMNFNYRHKGIMLKNVLSIAFINGNNSNYGAFSDYAAQNQYWDPYDSTGHIVKVLETIKSPITPGSTTSFYNPLYNAGLNVVNKMAYNNIINATNIEWLPAKGLRLSGRLQITKQHDETDRFLPASHTRFANESDITKKGSYTKGEGHFFSYDGTVQLDYSKRSGKHLLLNSTGGSITQTNSDYMTVTVTGFPNERLDQINFGNGYPPNTKPVYENITTRQISGYTNFNYSYDNRYSADLSIRTDGSSQFGSEKRFGTFWSAGVSWNLHKEKILADKPYINLLRIRTSMGTTGDSRFQSFMGISIYQYYTDQNYRGQVGAILTSFGNPNLQWQSTLKRNLGLDVGLFRNHVYLNFDVFRENTDQLILDITSPPSMGVTSYKENVGGLENRGYEFKLNIFPIKNEHKRLYWNIYVNGLHTRDYIKSISNSLKKLNQLNDANSTDPNSTDYNKQVLPQYRFQEGMSVNTIWAVPSLGIDPSNGREVFVKKDGTLTYAWNVADKVPAGNTIPDLRGSFGTNITWKGLSMGLYFSYEFGAQMYNQTLVNRVEVTDFTYNVDRRVLFGRWVKPGDETYFKGLVNENGVTITTPTNATSRFVQKNNFVNAESISVSYQLSDKLNKKLRIKNTRISFITNDLKRWSSIQVERGLDYPFARNFTLNVSTTF
ncbi:MAG TPA: SusC/RagA family TonB-linked outer membrane protein [Niastella sp.]